MNRRDNTLRAIRFEEPEYIPMTFHINDACWHHYDQGALKDLMEAHPLLFPDYERESGEIKPSYLLNARKDTSYTDPWGCKWLTSDDGITGSVCEHPLESWDDLSSYKIPNANETDGTYPVNWDDVRRRVKEAKQSGTLVIEGLPHGHTFLRLQDIRGYTNLIMDMVDEDLNLMRLIEMVSDFNLGVIHHWLELDPDVIGYPEDLGMQVGPMLSPALLRKYIKPVYRRLMQPARDKNVVVHMHCDGDIRTLVDDLIECGVDVLNLQDLVNGIDWIADRLVGRICVHLDIDRQRITPYGTAHQIDQLIRQEVEKLGSKKGGLMMVYGVYPGVPVENIKAVMDAMEKYMTYYS